MRISAIPLRLPLALPSALGPGSFRSCRTEFGLLVALCSICLCTASGHGQAKPEQPSGSPKAVPTPAQASDATIDLKELVARVRAEHRKPDAPAKVDRFRAQISLQALGRDADNHFSIQLDVKFQANRKLRYRIDEGERVIERGSDGTNFWQRLGVDEPIVNLRDREYETDRRALFQELRLARQLLQLLDPAAVLEQLQDAKVQTRLRGKQKQPTWFVTGQAKSFPVYARGGDGRWVGSEPVQLQLLIDGKTHRFIALRAQPLNKDGTPRLRSETVSVDQWQEVHGVQVPRKLTIIDVDPRRKTAEKFGVQLLQLQLQPKFVESEFQPPKG